MKNTARMMVSFILRLKQRTVTDKILIRNIYFIM